MERIAEAKSGRSSRSLRRVASRLARLFGGGPSLATRRGFGTTITKQHSHDDDDVVLQ